MSILHLFYLIKLRSDLFATDVADEQICFVDCKL